MQKYPYRHYRRIAALNHFLLVDRKGWSQAVWCKVHDPERRYGVLRKDREVTEQGERATKCLLRVC